MRYAPWMLAASLSVACAGEPSRPSSNAPSGSAPDVPGVTATPTTPNTPTSSTAFLWVVVADSEGFCIPGGSVRVVRGQLAGETRVQDNLPCSVWDYGMGVFFFELEPGVEMTITASAPGYADQTVSFHPHPFPQGAYFFRLERPPTAR